MSDYNINLLRTLAASIDKPGAQPKAAATAVVQVLRDIVAGLGTDEYQRRQLQPLLGQLLSSSIGSELRPHVERVIDKMRSDRRWVAECFYAARGESQASIDAINFDYEVEVHTLPSGTALYQWCAPLLDGSSTSPDKRKPAVCHDRDGYYIEVGSFFCRERADIDALGASLLTDLWQRVKGKPTFLGHVPRHLYRFVLPFDARCLVSIAGAAHDTWSARRNHLGKKLKEGWGIGTTGGARQYFIPLSLENKRSLARTGERIE